MHIKSAGYVASYVSVDDCPAYDSVEFAFAGRSNVGKSSLLNSLLNRKNLVRISATPGKTQTINYYAVNESMFFVDLPGYGYARVSKEERNKWKNMVLEFCLQRKQLRRIFLLIDSRIEPQLSDLEFATTLARHELNSALIFTKTDKQSFNKNMKAVHTFCNRLKKQVSVLPPVFLYSAVTNQGRDELLGFIESCS
jgi:GTP-binding protein